jgi:membrane protein
MAKPANALRAVAVVLGIVTALVILSQEWNQIRERLGALEFLVALPVVGTIYGALFVALLAQLPRPDDARWSRLVPGALFVGVVLASLQAFVLGYMARKLSHSSELYGGVGTAVVVLFWLYLIGRVLVLGPILDGVLWRRGPASVAEEP